MKPCLNLIGLPEGGATAQNGGSKAHGGGVVFKQRQVQINTTYTAY